MILKQGNFFSYEFNERFDGIITDMPYKKAFNKEHFEESEFNIEDFLKKGYEITIENGFLITFSNFRCLCDIIKVSESVNWKIHTIQIWDKTTVRTWISWNYPLRNTEYIIYLYKNKRPFCFKNGLVKKAYRRNQFGNKELIKAKRRNVNPISYGMYEDIIKIHPTRNINHKTEKPIEFSEMFANIVGKDRRILDCFCGSGNLLKNFENSLGIDINEF